MKLNRMLVPLALLGLALTACSGTQTTTTTTSQPQEAAEPTMVRFVHAIPDGPAFNAFVGETQVGTALNFTQFGNWTEVPSGERDVTIRSGEVIDLTDTYDFRPNQRYWIFAWGSLNPRGHEVPATFLIAPEESFESTGEDTWVRFANVVADGEGYGLTVTTGGSWNLLFPNQPVGTISEFKLGPVYENSFDVIPARDTSLPAVTSFDLNMQVGILYTIVVAGRAQGDQLEVFHIAESAIR